MLVLNVLQSVHISYLLISFKGQVTANFNLFVFIFVIFNAIAHCATYNHITTLDSEHFAPKINFIWSNVHCCVSRVMS